MMLNDRRTESYLTRVNHLLISYRRKIIFRVARYFPYRNW